MENDVRGVFMFPPCWNQRRSIEINRHLLESTGMNGGFYKNKARTINLANEKQANE
jgi:hypothetical protein